MKATVNLFGRNLIIPLVTAEKIAELAFAEAEIREEKWHSTKDGVPAHYTTHIYEIDPTKFCFNFELMTDAQYQMFKLAGKPD